MKTYPAGYYPLPIGPLRTLTVRMTREGVQTAAPKIGLLLGDALQVMAVFYTSYEATQTFLASAIDGSRMIICIDNEAPKRSAFRFPTITEDRVFTLDLNDGTGGAAGQPALLGARAFVEGVGAARDIVALERRDDGVWRVAGSLRTSDGTVDLRVSGGDVYAMAIDDFGLQFQPSLPVTPGQRIRPTTYAGWLYQITEAGTLPATEPTWWPAEGENAPRQLGTARAVAVRYYRPLAHGPITVEYT